jgi:hypothetical protein
MEQTNLNIGSIGQRLETARQAKGVSVSEAGQATKILSKFIEAMEADDFGALSAPVYAKSFLKMYATYLGIDAEPLVEEYVSRHVPRNQRPLSDEMRQNLAHTDHVTESPPAPEGTEHQIFGGVNQAIARLSGNRLSPRTIAIGSSVAAALILILLTVSQCDTEDEAAPESAAGAGSAAVSAERELLYENPPDAYLVEQGKIKTGK